MGKWKDIDHDISIYAQKDQLYTVNKGMKMSYFLPYSQKFRMDYQKSYRIMYENEKSPVTYKTHKGLSILNHN